MSGHDHSDLPARTNPILSQHPVPPAEREAGSVWHSGWYVAGLWAACVAVGIFLLLLVARAVDTRHDPVILPPATPTTATPVTVTSLRTVVVGGTRHVVTDRMVTRRAARTPEAGEVVPTTIPDPTGPAGGNSGAP